MLDQFIGRGVKPSLNKAGFATYGSNSFWPENFQLCEGQSTPSRQILGAGKTRILFKLRQWIYIVMKH
jgi:hypothetical protein